MCGADAYSVRKALILLPSTFFKSSLALSVEKASVVSWFIRSTFHWSLDESSEELDFWPNHPARKRPKESILYRDRGLIKHTWATNMCWSCNLSAIGFISNFWSWSLILLFMVWWTFSIFSWKNVFLFLLFARAFSFCFNTWSWFYKTSWQASKMYFLWIMLKIIINTIG